MISYNQILEEMPSRDSGYLGSSRRVRLVKQSPYLWHNPLPESQIALAELLLETELLHDFFLGRFVSVQIQAIQCLERFASVSVSCVRHPATRLHLADNVSITRRYLVQLHS